MSRIPPSPHWRTRVFHALQAAVLLAALGCASVYAETPRPAVQAAARGAHVTVTTRGAPARVDGMDRNIQALLGFEQQLAREEAGFKQKGREQAHQAAYAALIRQLRERAQALKLQSARQQAQFDAARADIVARHLPAVALQRYTATQSNITQQRQQLDQAADALGQPQDSQLPEHAALNRFFTLLRSQSTHGQGRADSAAALAPAQTALTARRPAQDVFGLTTRLYGQRLLAYNGSLSGLDLGDSTLVTTPEDGDVAEPETGAFTTAIRTKANDLGNNPVRIYNWVRNNVEFVPGWGLTQSPEYTLRQLRGNAYDINVLLASLLRAANIPTRFVYGTAELPAARVKSWLGTDVSTAQKLLSQANIPAQVSSSGTLQFEHLWLEAWVAGTPSRGARTQTGDSWWPLDASFKLLDQSTPLAVLQDAGINASALKSSASGKATCTADYAQGLDFTALTGALDQVRADLTQRTATAAADATVADVLGKRRLLPENFAVLLGSLPYSVIEHAPVMRSLPKTLHWQASLRLADASGDVINVTRPLSDLVDHRLTLSFAAQTADDQSILDSYLGSALPADIPAYLVRLKAELRLDGSIIASGGNFTLGDVLTLGDQLSVAGHAQGAESIDSVLAGELHSFVFDAHGFGADALQANINRLDSLKSALASPSGLTADSTGGNLLQDTAQLWLGMVEAKSRLNQRMAGVLEYRQPTVARGIARLGVQYNLGIAVKVSSAGTALALDRDGAAVISQDGDAASRSAYRLQARERASTTAAELLESLGTGNVAHATGRTLVRAQQAGQKVYRFDSSNAANAASLLATSPTRVLDQITQASGAGQDALTTDAPTDASGLAMQPLSLTESEGGTGSDTVTSAATPFLQGAAQIAGLAGWQGLSGSATRNVQLTAIASLRQYATTVQALLGDIEGTRWSAFVGRAQVIDATVLQTLRAAPDASACERMIAVLAGESGKALAATSKVNHAPQISSTPVTAATAGKAYVYAVQATDADGDALAYRLIGAPTGMSISASGMIQWAKPAKGDYALEVQADDGQAIASQTFTLSVGTQALPLDMSVAVNPVVVDPGQSVSVQVTVSGGAASITRSASLGGVAIALDGSGAGTLAAPATSGTYKILVTSTDGSATLTREVVLVVRDATDSSMPVAAITAPESNADLHGLVHILGTATDDHLAYYQLFIRPFGASDAAWKEIARGYSAVSAAELGTLDTSTYANGEYQLGLRVVDINGHEQSVTIPVELSGNLKLGEFKIAFDDINADASGMPLRLNRMYDSSRRAEMGDFGWGWFASANDITVRQNMVLGSSWQSTTEGSWQQCIRSVGKHRVTVTLPDGGLYRFEAHNSKECEFAVTPEIDIVYDALSGPTGGSAGRVNAGATLEVINNITPYFHGGIIYDSDTGEPWDPQDFRLTTAEGFIYTLRQGVGILQVKDPYGNTVDYGTNGYRHSANLAISLTRDAQGRITQATDPAGKTLVYTYNSQGELASVTDRAGLTTQFDYTRSVTSGAGGSQIADHLLAGITDPRGKRILQAQFDEYGRLAGSTDALGQQSQQSYDTANNQQIVTDRLGHTSVYTFDADGNITQFKDALGGITSMAYDVNGNVTSTTDPLGRVTTRTFDSTTGTQLTETDALGHTITTLYGTSGTVSARSNPLGVTDPKGNTTTYGYASGGSVPTSIVEPLGRTSNLDVDTNGHLSALSISGIKVSYQYDSAGNRIKETDSLGNSISYVYDANGNEVSSTTTRTAGGVTRTETTSRTYDSNNQVLTDTDATGAVRRYSWNAAGKISSMTDALGRTTTYTYDANARLTRIDFPDGTNEQTAYDANGNTLSETDRESRVTRYVYDALDRQTQTIYPDGTSETTEYDAAGQILAVTDRSGKRMANEYDLGGHLISSIDSLGRKTTYGYDANGNQISVALPDGRTTQRTYDALNRLTSTVYADGSQNSVALRADNRKQSETDERGVVTSYSYDGAGHLIGATQGNLSATYSYDETGQKIRQSDKAGHSLGWEFDAASRLVKRTLPDGNAEQFDYDVEGALLAHTTFGGHRIQSTYNSLGQEVSRVIPARSDSLGSVSARAIQWGYTPAGVRLTQTETGQTSSAGTTRYEYDPTGNLVKISAPAGVLEYAYDTSGRLVSRSVSAKGGSASTTAYQYDAGGRLVQATSPDGKQTTFTYDATDRLISSTQQLDSVKLVTERRYDAADRLIAIAHIKQQADGTASLILGQRIQRGTGGAVSRIDRFGTAAGFDATAGGFTGNPVLVNTFAYDANARLTQESVYEGTDVAAWMQDSTKSATRQISYQFDAAGNRSQKQVQTSGGTETTIYSYDQNDRLINETTTIATGASQTTTYAWDQNGNLSSKTAGTGFTGYLFDADNRLIEVKQGSNAASATTLVRYTYDGDGQRVGKISAAGNTTQYLIDPSHTFAQIAAETHRDANGAYLDATTYVWQDRLREQMTDGTVGKALIPLDGQLETSLGVIDGGGNLVEEYRQDAFGNANDGAASQPQLTHQLAGEYSDADTGLVYLRQRWYDPKSGRFLSIDPAQSNANNLRLSNHYLYASADPVNNVDPTGEMSLIELDAAMDTATDMAVAEMRQEGLDRIYGEFGKAFLNSAINFKGSNIGYVAGNPGAAALVTGFAVMCKTSKHCFLQGIPTFSTGYDLPAHSFHIINALMGDGFTKSNSGNALPFVLNRIRPRRDVSDRGIKGLCNGITGTKIGKLLNCDEYPYATTNEGGELNWMADRVSLMPVPSWESNKQGNKLNFFYNGASVKYNAGVDSLFLNISIPIYPTFSINRSGRIF
jgi:RHS repeat-associated protein